MIISIHQVVLHESNKVNRNTDFKLKINHVTIRKGTHVYGQLGQARSTSTWNSLIRPDALTERRCPLASVAINIPPWNRELKWNHTTTEAR